MTRSRSDQSPCGACKFLRRKCDRGCVFAPYFCHELGAAHFSAIHRVFGANNASKLLANLPVSGRCEAAFTIAYEAQARLQDPIYGCISHIFALQQQVVSLQSQLASLREQAAQNLISCSSCSNYDYRPNGMPQFDQNSPYTPPQDIHSWLQQSEAYNSCMNMPQFDQNSSTNMNEIMNFNNSIAENYENSVLNGSFSSFQEGSTNMNEIMNFNMEWVFQENSSEYLHSVDFGYISFKSRSAWDQLENNLIYSLCCSVN